MRRLAARQPCADGLRVAAKRGEAVLTTALLLEYDLRVNSVFTAMPLVVVLLPVLCTPAAAASATPTCGPVPELTVCETDGDCAVVDQIDCCPCSMGGRQAAINRTKEADLAAQLQVCCATAGICIDLYQCADGLAARCQGGRCELEKDVATASPTPAPTRNACTPAGSDCPVGTQCYCCCGTWACMPPYLPCCSLPCAEPTQVPTPSPTPRECNPFVNDCPSETSCGCCCGAWKCLDGSEICCEIACVLPSPVATATPTPPPSTCVGDCSGDGTVSVDEIVTMVDIALVGCSGGPCCASVATWCNANVRGVSVDCIIRAVDNVLSDCGVRRPTLTPQCSAVPCGGSCTISPPCTPRPDAACPDDVMLGTCVLNPFNGCQCQPTQPITPTPLPTPVLYHGHTCCECAAAVCTDFAWVEVEPTCPSGCETFADAECEAPCRGGPQSGPAACVPLTSCVADADCDDGNGDTADRCSAGRCTHQCVYV
jgi:hypothetical protein